MLKPYQGQEYSIDRLMRIYTHENFRIDKRDAAVTKKLIREELRRRVDTALRILDQMEDNGIEDTDSRVNRFYETQFLTGRL